MKIRGLSARFLTLAVSSGAALALLGIPASAAVAAPPTIDREWVTDVTANDATLHAEINPNGLYTAYRFQIDTTGNFRFERNDGCLLHLPGTGCTQAIVPGDPLPPGLVVPPESSIPAGYDSQHVSINMASIGATLQPGTTYHYRVVATNRIGEIVEGPDQTFTTPPGTAPPTIESESASNITPTDATLEAQINPGGLETTYEFRLETASCREMAGPGVTPCESVGEGEIGGTIPASSSTQTVTVDIAQAWHELSPNTSYIYSVHAVNLAGEAYGDEKGFKTLAGIPPTIESESVSNITPTDATLEAQINPGGLETSYEFRLETPECQMMMWPGVGCKLVGAGTIPAGSSTQTVSTDIAKAWQNLSPNTTYMYAVFATNSAGQASGRHEAWFTTAAASPPSIESESVSNITPTDATLEAQINTEGLETNYTFYVHEEGPPCLKADPPCMVLEQAPVPLPSGKLLGSFVGQKVSADLNSAGVSLSPGASYEYWVTATSAAGTTEGQPQTFTTPSTAEPPVIDRTPSAAIPPLLSSGARRGGPRKKTSRCERKLRHRRRGHGGGSRKHRHRRHARRGGKRRILQRVSGNFRASSTGRPCRLRHRPNKSRAR